MVNDHLEKEALFGIDSSSINDIVKNNDIDIVVCENIDDIENPSLIYNKLTDNIPNNAVVSLIVNSNITIKSIYNILNEIKEKTNPKLNIAYGFSIDDELNKNNAKILAIFTSKYEEAEIEPIKVEEQPKPKAVLKFANPEDRSLFEITKIMIEKEITSINLLQNEFGYGFNRSSSIFQKLEDLGIISKREDGKRRFLITNTKDIYNTICNHNLYISPDELNAKVYTAGQYILASGDTSINGIVNRFGYSFSEGLELVTILEDKGVLSKKEGTNPRRLLINNIHELYSCIYE